MERQAGNALEVSVAGEDAKPMFKGDPRDDGVGHRYDRAPPLKLGQNTSGPVPCSLRHLYEGDRIKHLFKETDLLVVSGATQQLRIHDSHHYARP